MKEKLNINKLIANHIIETGINDTWSFNYIVYLDSYLEEYDTDTQKYILDNKDNIIDIIARDERIADLQFDQKYNSIDMVYYIDQVLDRVENIVSTTAQNLGIDLEVEDIRSITDDLLDDDEFNDDMVRKIKSKDKDYEIWKEEFIQMKK